MDAQVAFKSNARETGRMRVLSVADEFTPDLGGRYRVDGDFSGEEFREDYLLGRFDQALRAQEELHVNFDGVSGMPPSFLEEAFGGLVRELVDVPFEQVEKYLKIEAPKSPKLWQYIKFAEDAMKRASRQGR